ncbi:hypothetical protein ACP275_06G176700 [Erythranthe tilingii]
MSEAKKMMQFIFLAYFIFGIGCKSGMGGVIIDISPIPCNGGNCDFVCSQRYCGNLFCAGGQCFSDPKIYGKKQVCLCNPR